MKTIKLEGSKVNERVCFSVKESKENVKFSNIQNSLKGLEELYLTRHLLKKRRNFDKDILSKEFGTSMPQ